MSTDTRTLKPGELFVALRGPRFNANDSSRPPKRAGAAGAVVDTRVDRPLAQIVVRDTQKALTQCRGRLARAVPGFPSSASAGSNGKTTAKEMIAAILERRGRDAGDARQPQQPHRRAAHAATGSSPRTARR